MGNHRFSLRFLAVLACLAVTSLAMAATPTYRFEIPAQPMAQALNAFARISHQQIVFDESQLRGRTSTAVEGTYTANDALHRILAGSGLTEERTAEGVIAIHDASDPPRRTGRDSPQASDVTQLGTITVTATKRKESLQKVPESITAENGADLARRGATGISDIVALAPGLSDSGGGPNQNNLTMRGISTGTAQGLQQSTVALLVDDIPMDPGAVAAATTDLRLFDIDRVEVLRGPQGTLFGAGSLSGAVRLITNKPDLDNFDWDAQFTLSGTQGGNSSDNVDAMINAPLVAGKLGLRAVAYDDREGGWIDNITTGKTNVNTDRSRGGRIEFAAQPTDRLSLRWTTIYQNDEPDSDGRSFFYPQAGANDYHNQEAQAVENTFTLKNTINNLVAQYQFNGFSLTSSTSYSQRRRAGIGDVSPYVDYLGLLFGIPGLHGNGYDIPDDRADVFTQEFRLSNDAATGFRWTAGMYYQKDNVNVFEYYTAPVLAPILGTPLLATIDSHVPQRDVALYGQADFPIFDRWDLTAGLRVAKSDISFQSIAAGLLLTGDPDMSNTITTTGAISQTSVDPKVAITYHVNDQTMLYAQASRGFRTGGPNLTAGLQPQIPTTYKSDSLWNYEIGEKAQFLDNKIRLNSALYMIDWSDIQISLEVPGAVYIGNAGAARVYGLETELVALPKPWLKLGLSASLNHSELTEAVPNLVRVTGLVGVSKGDRLPASPEAKLGGFVQTSFHVSDHPAYLRLGYQYVGREYTDFAERGLAFGDYSLFDFRAGINFDRMELIGFVDNIFNSHGRTTALDATSLGPIVFNPALAWRVRPRTIGVTFRVNY